MSRPLASGLDTNCVQPHDGHTHTYSDVDDGRAAWCRDCSITTPIAYLKGRRDRYLDQPTVVQCRTTAELRAAISAHRTSVHAIPDRPVRNPV